LTGANRDYWNKCFSLAIRLPITQPTPSKYCKTVNSKANKAQLLLNTSYAKQQKSEQWAETVSETKTGDVMAHNIKDNFCV